MKFKDILNIIKPVATIAGSFIPGVGAAIEVVNQFLPDDKKLTEAATGAELHDAVAGLPADQRAQLMGRDIDLKIAQEEGWTERYTAMCAGDGQSTRPQIALMMAWCVVAAIVLSSSLIAYGIYAEVNVEDYWPLFGAMTVIPAEVLRKYFGELRREQGQRLGTPGKSILDKLFRR